MTKEMSPLTLGFIGVVIFLGAFTAMATAKHEYPRFDQIKNFRFVSPELASSGMLSLDEYSGLKDYGFKHVINLIPGNQLKERRHVESLGMSYEQIPVDWEKPTTEDFNKFVTLMRSYGTDKVYIHCQLNWRASTFVYLYRVTQLKIDPQMAKMDLLAIWEPEKNWSKFIKLIESEYKS